MTPITQNPRGRSICNCPAATVPNVHSDPIENPCCDPIGKGTLNKEAAFVDKSPANTVRALICKMAKVLEKQRPGSRVCAGVEQQDASRSMQTDAAVA